MALRFLILGAIVSCVAAVFIFFYVGYSLLWFWLAGIRAWDYFLTVGIFIAYLILAVTPTIMLIRVRKIEKPKTRFIVIGVIETIAIGLFLAMLLRVF